VLWYLLLNINIKNNNQKIQVLLAFGKKDVIKHISLETNQ
jgi:hypothetical protein